MSYIGSNHPVEGLTGQRARRGGWWGCRREGRERAERLQS